MHVRVVELGNDFFMVLGDIWINVESITYINTHVGDEGGVLIRTETIEEREDYAFANDDARDIREFLEGRDSWTF